MDPAAVLSFVERIGVPVAVLAAATFLLWRTGGRLVHELVASYRERIAGLEGERDHFRDRSEAADDRTQILARELIDECRSRANGRAEGVVRDE